MKQWPCARKKDMSKEQRLNRLRKHLRVSVVEDAACTSVHTCCRSRLYLCCMSAMCEACVCAAAASSSWRRRSAVRSSSTSVCAVLCCASITDSSLCTHTHTLTGRRTDGWTGGVREAGGSQTDRRRQAGGQADAKRPRGRLTDGQTETGGWAGGREVPERQAHRRTDGDRRVGRRTRGAREAGSQTDRRRQAGGQTDERWTNGRMETGGWAGGRDGRREVDGWTNRRMDGDAGMRKQDAQTDQQTGRSSPLRLLEVALVIGRVRLVSLHRLHELLLASHQSPPLPLLFTPQLRIPLPRQTRLGGDSPRLCHQLPVTRHTASVVTAPVCVTSSL